MPSRADRIALGKTIEQAGVGSFDPLKIKWVAFAEANPSDNELVYGKANDVLVDLVKDNSVGQCIHVTGEMRALADPFHRRVCAEIHQRSDHKFSLVYNIPKNYRETPEGVGQWNAESWRRSGWVDRLSAFNIIGKDIVDVFAYDTLDSIQFTVFGDRYVLLQEKHPDEVNVSLPKGARISKRVWLLKCEKLNSAFARKASEIKGEAEPLSDALFRRFAISIHGVTSREIIGRLIKSGGKAHRDAVIDDQLMRFDANVDAHITSLKTIGFVSCDKSTLTVTDQGRQYFAIVGAKAIQSAGGVS